MDEAAVYCKELIKAALMLTHKHLLGRHVASLVWQFQPEASAFSTTVSCLLMISRFHQGDRWRRRLHVQSQQKINKVQLLFVFTSNSSIKNGF